MRILEYRQDHGYEQLVACHDPAVGLKAFIAIYDTSLTRLPRSKPAEWDTPLSSCHQ